MLCTHATIVMSPVYLCTDSDAVALVICGIQVYKWQQLGGDHRRIDAIDSPTTCRALACRNIRHAISLSMTSS